MPESNHVVHHPGSPPRHPCTKTPPPSTSRRFNPGRTSRAHCPLTAQHQSSDLGDPPTHCRRRRYLHPHKALLDLGDTIVGLPTTVVKPSRSSHDAKRR